MSLATHIKASLELPQLVVKSYLDDLTDQDLFLRPAEKANHIAWQLGHLISAEHSLIEAVCPGTMPALPEGFDEQYSKETSASDEPAQFHSKAEYIRLMEEQRAGTLAALESLSDEQLEQPAPEKLQIFGSTVGAIFAGQATHWMMHAGQWVIVRRQLGREPLF